MYGTPFTLSEFCITWEKILRLSELTCRGPRAQLHLLRSGVIKEIFLNIDKIYFNCIFSI